MPKFGTIRKQQWAALVLASTPILLAGETASAAEQFYVGAGVGYTRDGSGCEVVDATTNTILPTASCDTNSIEGKLYGGYRFNDFLGVELGYMGLRSTSITLVDGRSGKFEASGIPIQAVVFLPASTDLSWMGKLGVVRWSGKASGRLTGSQSDSGFSFVLGAGAEYNLGNNLAIRGEIEYFPKIGDKKTVGEADITAIGVSLKYSF